jgi:chorismate mutase / prephenate dehydrogenase
MAVDELESLRAGLARTDEEIRRGISRRLDLAKRIGQAKQRRRIPIRDRAVERQVLERWRTGLGEIGVSAGRAETLAQWLVEEAVRVQEERRPGNGRHGPSRRVLVVGGAGSMGSWAVEYLQRQGHRVEVYDPAALAVTPGQAAVRRDLARAARDADVVLVSTPMRVAASVYRRLERSGTHAAIVDLLSVKAPLRRWLVPNGSRALAVASVHPLFGPSARTLSGRNLLLLDCGDPRALRAAAELFPARPLQVTRLPVEEHDPLMADLQALPRVISLLMVAALTRSGRDPATLRWSETTSFHRASQTAREVLSENPALSLDIQSLNPTAGALFDRLEASLAELRRIVREDDGEAYARLIQAGRAMLGEPPAPSRGSPRRRRATGAAARPAVRPRRRPYGGRGSSRTHVR